MALVMTGVQIFGSSRCSLTVGHVIRGGELHQGHKAELNTKENAEDTMNAGKQSLCTLRGQDLDLFTHGRCSYLNIPKMTVT